jgi:hypothetical protein
VLKKKLIYLIIKNTSCGVYNFKYERKKKILTQKQALLEPNGPTFLSKPKKIIILKTQIHKEESPQNFKDQTKNYTSTSLSLFFFFPIILKTYADFFHYIISLPNKNN